MSICLDCGYTDDFCHCAEPKPTPPEVPVMRKVLTNPQIDATDCVRCHGAGMRGPDEPCPVCEGTGGEPRYAPEVSAPDEVELVAKLLLGAYVLSGEEEVLEPHDCEKEWKRCEAWHAEFMGYAEEFVRYVRAREGGR